MLKKLLMTKLITLMFVFLVSCIPNESLTVTFVYGDDRPNTVLSINVGETIVEPASPTRQNYIFHGWFTHWGSRQNEFAFNEPITSNTRIYAHFNFNYDGVMDHVADNLLRATVRVVTRSYNTFLGITTSVSYGFGSGVIFHVQNSNHFFVLTNNHVTQRNRNFDRVRHYIYDYRGNRTRAHRVVDQRANFDLAVVEFRRTSGPTLGIIPRATSNIRVGDRVISIGHPRGEWNRISFGRKRDYRLPNVNAPSYMINVNFNVMQHDSYIRPGSSGGVVLDTRFRMVGINFAYSSWNGHFISGLAIPIERVNEFLNRYIWQ